MSPSDDLSLDEMGEGVLLNTEWQLLERGFQTGGGGQGKLQSQSLLSGALPPAVKITHRPSGPRDTPDPGHLGLSIPGEVTSQAVGTLNLHTSDRKISNTPYENNYRMGLIKERVRTS